VWTKALTVAQPLSLDRRVEEALLSLWRSLESPESRRGYESDWRRWVAWCGETRISAAEATTLDVQRYLADMQLRGLSRATRARALAVLRKAYGAFVRAGVLEVNPAREAENVRISTDPRTPWLAEDELRAILRRRPFPTWIQRRNWLLVAMFIGTGLRRAEVARLRRSTFRRGPHGLCVEVTVKGGKVGTVTIPRWLEQELTAFRCAGDHVFPAHEGIDKPVGHTTVWKAVKEAAGAAGVPLERATPHALRRSYVTLARSRGVSLEDLQAALLHSNRATTERYDYGAVMRPAPGEALADLVDPGVNPWDALKQR